MDRATIKKLKLCFCEHMSKNLIYIFYTVYLYAVRNLDFLREILFRKKDFGESESDRFLYSVFDMRNRPDLSEQASFAECDKVLGDNSVGYTAYKRHCYRKICTGLVKSDAPGNVNVDVVFVEFQTHALFKNCNKKTHSVMIKAVTGSLCGRI